MNTDELIRGLVREARPVKRSKRPIVSFSMWSAIGVLYLAVGVMLIGARNDLAQVWRESVFLIHTLTILAVAVAAGAAAFVLGVPDRQQRWIVWIPAIALTAWLAWIVGALVSLDEPLAGDGWKCLKNIFVLSAPIGMLMYCMLSRAAPLRTSTTGWLATLAASAAGDLATRFICRNDHALHALVWHFAPVLVMGCLGVVLGRMLLRWEAADSMIRNH